MNFWLEEALVNEFVHFPAAVCLLWLDQFPKMHLLRIHFLPYRHAELE